MKSTIGIGLLVTLVISILTMTAITAPPTKTPIPTATVSLPTAPTAAPTPAVQTPPRPLTKSEITEIIWGFGPYNRGIRGDRFHVTLLSWVLYLDGVDESELPSLIVDLSDIPDWYDYAKIPEGKLEMLPQSVRDIINLAAEALAPPEAPPVNQDVYDAVDEAFTDSGFSYTELGVDGGRLKATQMLSVYNPTSSEQTAIRRALTKAAEDDPEAVFKALQSSDICALMKLLARYNQGFNTRQKASLNIFINRTGCK